MFYILAFSLLFAATQGDIAVRDFGLRGSHKRKACGGIAITFDEFLRHHGRGYATNAQEYKSRKALFDQRVEEAKAHNCMPGKRLWTAGLTSLSDRTSEELAMLRGRKGAGGNELEPSSGGGSRDRLAALDAGAAGAGATSKLPEAFDWLHLQSMKEVLDQGSCGSCWASASTVMLRAHSDIYQQHHNFSVQQLVSCVPNPQECGGNGGCNGSTGELALDYVMHNGLGTDLTYKDGDSPCPASMIAKNSQPVPQPMSSSFLSMRNRLPAGEALSPARSFGMVGWSRLPVNSLDALKRSIYHDGPVAVSVVAGYAWNAYVRGIMNNCSKSDMVVNHLVVLVGYGADAGLGAKYWHIQNSWGTDWGEDGFMRMIRKDDDEEESHCGVDEDPSVGTGCKGGPGKVWVCGSCGILYDNVVAHFHGDTPSAMQMLERRSGAAEFTSAS